MLPTKTQNGIDFPFWFCKNTLILVRPFRVQRFSGVTVVGKVFSTIHNSFFNASEASNFFTIQRKLFNDRIQLDPEVKMMTFQAQQRRFEASEMARSEKRTDARNAEAEKLVRTLTINLTLASKKKLSKKLWINQYTLI